MKYNAIMIALPHLVCYKLIAYGNVNTIPLSCLVCYLICNGINFASNFIWKYLFLRLSILLLVIFSLIIAHDMMREHMLYKIKRNKKTNSNLNAKIH